MATHSPKYELIKSYYPKFWSKHRVAKAVELGYITVAEYEEITDEPYPTEGE